MKSAADICWDIGIQPPSFQIGRCYTTCPMCSRQRSRAHQKNKCLGITIDDKGVKVGCNHCGWTAGGFYEDIRSVDPEILARRRAEAAQREHDAIAERLRLGRWLWSLRRPVAGSIVERYLRGARAYDGIFPATLGYLPPREDHPPAMIAAFGFATEPAPGEIAIADHAVRGVQLTKLKPDGSGKADVDPNKITIGRSFVAPIVLAPVNDLLGLAFTEGIEDGLSVFQATGLGVWVAGSHTRMPALAAVVPDYVECCTIFAHDDDGKPNALELARALYQRGNIEVLVEGLAP
jgi:hypothetical protein